MEEELATESKEDMVKQREKLLEEAVSGNNLLPIYRQG